MRQQFIFVLLAVAIVCASCATQSFSKLGAIPQSRIYAVVAEVKRQVSVYQSYQESQYGYAAILKESRTKACGNGLVGFDIVSVQMQLVATSQGSQNLSASLSPIPVNTAGTNTVGGKVGASSDTTDTQTLTIQESVIPSPVATKFSLAEMKGAPLARAMINLWAAALQSGDDATDICLQLKAGAEGENNTYTMGITVVTDANGSVSVGLAPVGLTAGGEFKATNGNTITVKFEPHDFTRPPRPRPPKCKPGEVRPGCPNVHFL